MLWTNFTETAFALHIKVKYWLNNNYKPGIALAAFHMISFNCQILSHFTDKETGSVVPMWLHNSILWPYRSLLFEAFNTE